jgi:HSP20 family molecular chaperone IbpA
MISNCQNYSFSINACDMDAPQGLHRFHWSIPLSNQVKTVSEGREKYLFKPTVEIQETGDAFYVLLELPGLDCQEISIQIVHDKLSIQGYRKPKFHIPARAVLDSEFHYGAFERTILIPEPVKHDQVIAEYVNGILTISLMKENH